MTRLLIGQVLLFGVAGVVGAFGWFEGYPDHRFWWMYALVAALAIVAALCTTGLALGQKLTVALPGLLLGAIGPLALMGTINVLLHGFVHEGDIQLPVLFWMATGLLIFIIVLIIRRTVASSGPAANPSYSEPPR